MNKQFTASEVRGQIAWLRNVTVVGTKPTYQMLDAFADMLEAQERAVPVVTLESAINAIEHIGRYNGPGRDTEARQMLVEGPPSVVRPAPSDAERLAEALRNLVSEWMAVADDGDTTMEDSAIGYRACANRLSAMLTAQENPNG